MTIMTCFRSPLKVVCLVPEFSGESAFEELLDILVRNAVNHRAEEALEDQLLGFGSRNTT